MHAAALSLPSDFVKADFQPIGLADRSGEDHLEVFDNPEEWAAFSRAVGNPEGAVEWESQVLVRGMHCAACALTL